jgi:uncharacterized protein (DUF2147 family)
MRKFSFSIILCLSTIILAGFTVNQDNPDAILGVWKNGEGTGMIKISKNGDKYQGRIVWLKEPNDPDTGKPKLDKNHPEAENHSRPVLGLTNMWGFEYKGKNVWDGGKIYDPKNGNTYDCTVKMKDANTLEVRGYIGVSLIGRTDVWTRQVVK